MSMPRYFIAADYSEALLSASNVCCQDSSLLPFHKIPRHYSDVRITAKRLLQSLVRQSACTHIQIPERLNGFSLNLIRKYYSVLNCKSLSLAQSLNPSNMSYCIIMSSATLPACSAHTLLVKNNVARYIMSSAPNREFFSGLLVPMFVSRVGLCLHISVTCIEILNIS